MKEVINVDDLFLAEFRIFDLELNASEIPPVYGYVFLVKDRDCYKNVFYPELDYPVYERVPYANTTLDGEDYGSKIKLAQGELSDGPCYIIKCSFSNINDKRQISIDELKKYIFQSDKFFLDRVKLLQDHQLSTIECLQYDKKLMHDMFLLDEFPDYFEINRKKVLKKFL